MALDTGACRGVHVASEWQAWVAACWPVRSAVSGSAEPKRHEGLAAELGEEAGSGPVSGNRAGAEGEDGTDS